MPRKINKQYTAYERPEVKIFVKKFLKIHPDVLIKIDQDSPSRQFSSGWDFKASYNTHVIYVEAKYSIKPATKPLDLLSEFQLSTRIRTKIAKTPYFILEFFPGQRARVIYLDDSEKWFSNYEDLIKEFYKYFHAKDRRNIRAN